MAVQSDNETPRFTTHPKMNKVVSHEPVNEILRIFICSAMAKKHNTSEGTLGYGTSRRGGGHTLTSNVTEAGNDVNNARGEASLFDKFANIGRRQRRFLRALDDNGVSRGDSRSELEDEKQDGHVPWDDGFGDGQCESSSQVAWGGGIAPHVPPTTP
jgi:hypothetical protein